MKEQHSGLERIACVLSVELERLADQPGVDQLGRARLLGLAAHAEEVCEPTVAELERAA